MDFMTAKSDTVIVVMAGDSGRTVGDGVLCGLVPVVTCVAVGVVYVGVCLFLMSMVRIL